jgi:hypothetical protein
MRKITLPLLLALLSVYAPAAAQAETASQAVTAKAAKLPAGTTPVQAAINRQALKAVVAKAIKAGEGKALLETSTDPDVKADILIQTVKIKSVSSGEHKNHHKPKKPNKGITGPAEVSKGPQPEPITDKLLAPLAVRASVSHGPVAHAAFCGGNWAADTDEGYAFGGTVAWAFVRNEGWCGNGYEITWDGGPDFDGWTWNPEICSYGWNTNYSWDGSTAWIHMEDNFVAGFSYPWGCYGWWELKAVVRVAANGYWDTYDDFGF